MNAEDEKFAVDFVDVFGGFPKDQAIAMLVRRQSEIRAPNLDLTPGGMGECGCGTRTKYVCPFCKIKAGKIRWLCEQPECREKHEQSSEGCSRTPSRAGKADQE